MIFFVGRKYIIGEISNGEEIEKKVTYKGSKCSKAHIDYFIFADDSGREFPIDSTDIKDVGYGIVFINKPYRTRRIKPAFLDNLLIEKGFSLNEYPEGKFWEFEVKEDEKLKEKLCKIFGAAIDNFVNGTDIDTLILQCAEDFTKCLFYYDCNPFDMSTEEFMKCVGKM